MPNLLPDRLAGALAYRNAKQNPELERLDACGGEWLAVPEDVAEHTRFNLAGYREGSGIPHGGKVLKDVRGMGKILDWRTSDWTPANGGKIRPLAFVHHIPVVPNTVGIDDFIVLRNVLVAQGLMVQSATDREGNVALFTPFNQLCYQARGGNQQTTGCEHMHATIGEAWTKHQMRAAAWVVQLARRQTGIPALNRAQLGTGSGIIRIAKRGQTTHQAVSDAAGFHDRTDPGPGFDWAYLYHCVRYFRKHGHFANA